DRPRGVHGLGGEESNGYVHIDSGGGETMARATQIEVYDGLRARSLRGKGELDETPDRRRYDKTHTHCDVLVVGGGPAGLAAALAAGASGARVIMADEQSELGGGLLASRARLDGGPAVDWVAEAGRRLAAMPEVRVLTRTTVVGYHDHNYLIAVERRTDHLGDAAPPDLARQRLWHIRAAQVVLATGALERPIAFCDNDRPGVMSAGAAAGYANRYGVLPGRRAVVFGAHDGVVRAAADLAAAGVDVAELVDVRDGVGVVGAEADADGVLTGAHISALDSDGRPVGRSRTVACDLLAVSGGWNPVVHLFSQSGGTLAWSESAAAFVPSSSAQQERSAGAANGTYELEAAIAEGAERGLLACRDAGYDGAPASAAPITMPSVEPATPDALLREETDVAPVRPPAAFFCVEPGVAQRGVPCFVDLQRDVTLHNVREALAAGMRSSELVKRHTTIGTGADQGKTSSVLTVGVLAGLLGRPMTEVGATSYRPPYHPVSFALLAGRDRGRLADPERVTPMHPWHLARGAPFEDVGQWKRPWCFPLPDEDLEHAVLRECRAAREGVAVMDASTLGKIELQGADVGEFLDRIYTGVFSTLKVGRSKYGLMCGADGMLFDDGTTSRLSEDRWLLTTTTGNAAAVLDWLEEWLQTEWPDLDVRCTSVTDHWATAALVGPRSRDVLRELAPELDVSNEAFGFMTFRDAEVAGLPARVFRISFSGELAYEINTPAWHGLALWEALLAAGEPYRITPYGTETMHVLRAEKGFPIVGQDTDGTVTPHDLGMGWAVSKQKPDFIGRRSHQRPDTARPGRKQLVGVLPQDPDVLLAEGAQLVAAADLGASAGPEDRSEPIPMQGHVTSSYRSAALGRTFGLAMVVDGGSRHGEVLSAVNGADVAPVTIVRPVFYDPEGARRDG
ncbi:MAG: glycine cleavage T C-terminal barrel domain-containing protein, partial [Micromonosporaceae bacterium]